MLANIVTVLFSYSSCLEFCSDGMDAGLISYAVLLLLQVTGLSCENDPIDRDSDFENGNG